MSSPRKWGSTGYFWIPAFAGMTTVFKLYETMNILAIDTSTRNLSLAVAQNGAVLKYRNRKLQRPLSSSIIPSIKEILNASGIDLKDIDGYAVGLGPGSFTSLRVGLSTIKGLAFSSNKPVVGISSLDVLAMNIPQNKATICVLCDAKRSLVYSCIFEKEGESLIKKSDYILVNIGDVLKKIKGEIVFIGDGIALYKDEIRKAKNITPTFIEGKNIFPQARKLVSLAEQHFQKKKFDDINKLVPLYLYPEHCQIRK